MNPQANPAVATPVSGPYPARCIHRTPSGRRCLAEAVDPQASFCRRHLFGSTRRYPDPSLAAELLGPLIEFQSPSDVTNFLSRLLILQAQDRISPRRAAVMAYTCNLLLRALRSRNLEAPTEVDMSHPIIDMIRSRHRPVSDTTGAPINLTRRPDSGRIGATIPADGIAAAGGGNQ